MNMFGRHSRIALVAGVLALAATAPAAAAATGAEIDARVDAAMATLHKEVAGSADVTSNAKGVLVFPEVVKAGFVIGGEGGEGSLRVGGKTVAYYNIGSASIGLQAGAQKRDIIIAFMDDSSLKKFQDSDGWKAGVDGSVTLIDVGATGKVDVGSINKPIVAFVVGEKGLMAGVSIDGSKISKIEK